MIDLHTHSTASDGTLTPRELVLLAKKEGLKALALTDHDTVDGLKEAYETAKEVNLPFLCGVEISIKFDGPGHFHLLGYFLTPEIKTLDETLSELKKARKRRNESMIEKLRSLGIEITMEELSAIAQGEIGRPHFARLLLEKGVVKSMEEAFEKYLKKGAPAYVPKALLTPDEGIRRILESKGVPVLAHPVTLKLDEKALKEYLEKLKELGLRGVEVYYSEHNKHFTNFLLSQASRLGLLVTGGSDFHGANKPDIKLGRGFGNLQVPYECFVKLKEALEKVN
ncbi:MAG: phosphoesterase [Caldimicrobium thiodismutans]|uniref:Phosphoesterase n=1 Tax=Caldimicrobium thiodismutans TaxID=1653476 RepID=A0A2N7PL90_9BACT|nr:MAG: phosphoesterase [Caldimicrobium thiodismutans]